MEVLKKLEQDVLFIQSWKPMDFMKNMGLKSVELLFTNGDTQMLTTPTDRENIHQNPDFKDFDEFNQFVKMLQDMNIPRHQELR